MDRRTAIQFVAACTITTGANAVFSQNSSGIDHRYAAWDTLLKKYVQWLPDGKQSRVDYRGLTQARADLQAILAGWSGVSKAQFEGFSPAQRQAFLINAYNGFTLELVLGKYPDLKSIKDLGTLFQSPWKKQWFPLLGEQRSLDWVEHAQLRPVYKDPRLHAALNCASIGCPALRPEAFTDSALQRQLDDGMQRFMGDPTRNRYADGTLYLNAIFKWYRADFEKGHLGLFSLSDVGARYADQLSSQAEDRARLKAGGLPVEFLDYDWRLNDLAR
ncbi:DUF547 domain-containing protein [Rhodoferax aquaticus]|uniref:DUF547 domain-containing protein n=1 Tax=Rhodoferax aquaticus TaxID=2527691 RepID=A0A515EST5_9BURK|nr:DUF547 domain-containing protein [Rhodoferax aquaticus]QDL55727.1 DUF547 domain-containing protein [Rhodoferax aquaticus]